MQNLTQRILSSMRILILGIEDGLVSSLGVVTGIAAGTEDRFVIILSGITVALVEALSMAAGTYLSDKSAKEVHVFEEKRDPLPKKLRQLHDIDKLNPAKNALAMYFANTFGGVIPVFPYLIFPIKIAMPISVLMVITILFVVGAEKGRLTRTNPLRSGLEMALISSAAASLGFLIGKTASIMFPNIKIQ